MAEEKDSSLAKELQDMFNEVAKEWGGNDDDEPVESNNKNETAKDSSAIQEKPETRQEATEVSAERELPKKTEKGKLSLLDFWGFKQ